jgi:localization factor PodJL
MGRNLLLLSLFLSLILPFAAAASDAPSTVDAALTRAEEFLASAKAEIKKRGFRTVKEKAEAGAEKAQLRLAELYYRGEGVAKDVGAAWGWYEKAAEQGSAKALRLLSVRYRLGCDGAVKNLAKAEDFLKRARAYVTKEEYPELDEAAKATSCPRP